MVPLDAIRAAAVALGLALPEEALTRLDRYVALVFKWQRLANLTGAPDESVFVAEHIADCLAILPWIGDAPLADIGSGAGLPGLVIACIRPELEIALVEPRAKRARFLQQCVIDLDLPRVRVINLKVEEWQPAALPEVLICRALSSLESFVDSTRHLQTPVGRLLAMKGRIPEDELAARWAAAYRVNVHPLQVQGRDTRCLVELRPGSGSA
ncbi:MAG: 16S rRNA (guanine(527)-N(7))-methyltransferase RsmG [Gammaproteobacteria bacterium]|nr:16S rRNA (guanine(527)-N(7))-methyltransferase RsmG [Gammaproteobacteria bacterium]